MGLQELFVIFIVISAIPSSFAQLYDFSTNQTSGLKYPCGVSGVNGIWKFEEANKYSDGPTDGTVFSSDATKMSCLVTTELIQVTSNTNIYIQVYVPYTTGSDFLYGWLIAGNSEYEVFKISGPTSSENKWIETSFSMPSDIISGAYYLEVWDTSTKHSVSFRYIEIGVEQITTEAATTSHPVTSPPDNDMCPPCSCTCSCSITN